MQEKQEVATPIPSAPTAHFRPVSVNDHRLARFLSDTSLRSVTAVQHVEVQEVEPAITQAEGQPAAPVSGIPAPPPLPTTRSVAPVVATAPVVAPVVTVHVVAAPIEQRSSELCCICFETFAECIECECAKPVCASCMTAYLEERLSASYGYIAPVKCPSCSNHMPMKVFEKFLPDETSLTYRERAYQALSMRCPNCDQTTSLLRTEDDPDGLVELLESMDYNGLCPVTEQQKVFITSTLADCQRFGNGLLSKEELFSLLQTGLGCVPNTRHLHALLPQVPDVERQAALFLYSLRQHPKTVTACCCYPMCFKCQIDSHTHQDFSCEEYLTREELPDDVRRCPSCSAALFRSDGCNHVLCFCGTAMCYACGQLSEQCDCHTR
eukprot:GILJ01002596.1.p1 GENE.GILJ01002596.1~~GILJ01002596.1.p1  ORF type:complete len:432 (-),score=43.68 GILJ01002596.1:458-1600(-)